MKNLGGNSPPMEWVYAIGTDKDLSLGLDRHLVFNKLPMKPADAEATIANDPAGDGYTARITIRARDALLTSDSKKPFGIVSADLVSVEILRKDGAVLAMLKPDDFPREEDVQEEQARAESSRLASVRRKRKRLLRRPR